jgi:hypothetical protein
MMVACSMLNSNIDGIKVCHKMVYKWCWISRSGAHLLQGLVAFQSN